MHYEMMAINYGHLLHHQSYAVACQRKDWVGLKSRGKITYVPRSYLFDDPISETYKLRKHADVDSNEDEDFYFGGFYE